MEKIELLEKLTAVQGQHIELMQDFSDLLNTLKSLEESKNRRIQDLNVQIEYQDERIAILERQNNELKQQYEELQKSLVSVEQNQ